MSFSCQNRHISARCSLAREPFQVNAGMIRLGMAIDEVESVCSSALLDPTHRSLKYAYTVRTLDLGTSEQHHMTDNDNS